MSIELEMIFRPVGKNLCQGSGNGQSNGQGGCALSHAGLTYHYEICMLLIDRICKYVCNIRTKRKIPLRFLRE